MGQEEGRQDGSIMERDKIEARSRRHRRVRKRVFGTPDKPRLCVYRSLKHIYAQLIDDTTHRTLLCVSTQHKDVKKKLNGSMSKCEESKVVGSILAKKAKRKKIAKIVFDRSGYRFHGRVKNLAAGAREEGLVF